MDPIPFAKLLIGNSPEERYLVHGGYGFGNVRAQDGRITAILDWMDARYGDFLFDVARLDFWSPEDAWHARFQQHYEHMSREVLLTASVSGATNATWHWRR